MWKYVYLLISIVLCSDLIAQDGFWIIEGKVLDSTYTAIPFCLVYSSQLGTDDLHSYDYSNEDGVFSLVIHDSLQNVNLHFKAISYKEKSIKVERSNNRYLDINLQARIEKLEEVIITTDRPTVTQNSDTTVYNLKDFRDSTEYNVEDLIAKIPGVSISEDGSIEVNGKSIKTVLIEDSDLFGREYSLATRNIRADFVDKIEIIDHYEENPVLKNVNLSEEVVLNLLIKEEKKNIVTGTLNPSVGYGNEFKSKFHANLFFFSRKNKIVVLSDNGNIGKHTRVNDFNFFEKDYQNRQNSFNLLSLLDNYSISKIPAPSELYDNSWNSFHSIRSEHNVGKNWKLKLHATPYYTKDEQNSKIYQRYLYDEKSFNIETQDELKILRKKLNLEGIWSYLNPTNTKSFESKFSIDGSDDKSSKFSILENQNLVANKEINNLSLFFNNLYTFQTRKSGVIQLGVNSFLNQSNEGYFSNKNILVNLLEPGIDSIEQRLNLNQYGLHSFFRFMKSFNNGIISVELYNKIKKEQITNSTDYLNIIGLWSEFQHDPSKNLLKTNTSGLTARFQKVIFRQLNLNLNFDLFNEDRNFTSEGINISSFQNLLVKPSISISKKSIKSNIRLGYFYAQDINGNGLFNIDYITDLFEFRQNKMLIIPSNVHAINLFYNFKPILKLYTFGVNMNYRFYPQSLTYAYTFRDEDLSILEPLLLNSRTSFSTRVFYDQFLASKKINLNLSSTYLINRSPNSINGEEVVNMNNQFINRIIIKLPLTNVLKLNLTYSNHINSSKNSLTDNTLTVFTSNSMSSSIWFRTKSGWTGETEYAYVHNRSIGEQLGVYSGLNVTLKKSLKTHENNNIDISLKAYNILNASTFSSYSIYNIFVTEYEIEAIPTYFILTFDMSF